MFRTTTLATLSVLALSGCIATPASAQYLYGSLHDYSCTHHDHGYRGYNDSHCGYLRGHDDYHGYGPTAYPNAALSRHHSVPVYVGRDCPYGNDAACTEPIGCPLQQGRVLPDRLRDEFEPGFDLGESSHNHSHDGHSHGQQVPGRDLAPSDRGYVAPPTLPRGSVNDFRREQPRRDDSIRMDNPPPPSFGQSSPTPPSSDSPKRFDSPPPTTL